MTNNAITQLEQKAVGFLQYTYQKADGDHTTHSWCCSSLQPGLLDEQCFHPRKGFEQSCKRRQLLHKVATIEKKLRTGYDKRASAFSKSFNVVDELSGVAAVYTAVCRRIERLLIESRRVARAFHMCGTGLQRRKTFKRGDSILR